MKWICVALALLAPLDSRAESFGKYDCKGNCAGHEAGYSWAEAHNVVDADECPQGRGRSFYEGCLAYTDVIAEAADAEFRALKGPRE